MGIGVLGIYEYTTSHESNTSAATANATNFGISNAGEVNNNCKLCIIIIMLDTFLHFLKLQTW